MIVTRTYLPPFVAQMCLIAVLPGILQTLLGLVVLVFKHGDAADVVLIRDLIALREALKLRESRSFHCSDQIATQMDRVELEVDLEKLVHNEQRAELLVVLWRRTVVRCHGESFLQMLLSTSLQ